MLRRNLEEAGAGIGLAAIGAFVFALARKMPQGPDPSAPGPGVAPTALGAILFLLGLVIAAAVVLRQHLPAEDTAARPDQAGRKLLIAAVMLAGCVIAFEIAGFMLASFIFLLSGFILLGNADWRAAAPAAAFASGSLWLLFTKLLGVGLPYGVIGEILFR